MEEVPPPPPSSLSEAKCCRLCAVGAEDEEGLKEERTFHPLFGGGQISPHQRINQYLPIEVVETDSCYPKLVCVECLDQVGRTIEFFDKICEGQRKLAKILNDVKAEERIVAKKHRYSSSKPLQQPRRRGRPKKAEKSEESSCSKKGKYKRDRAAKEFVAEVLDRPRAKRQSRPPARYIDEVLPKSLGSAEDIDESGQVDQIKCEEPEPQQGSSSQVGNFERPSGTSTVSLMSSLQAEFALDHNQRNLMDLGRFDILMNDDVAETVSKMVTELAHSVNDRSVPSEDIVGCLPDDTIVANDVFVETSAAVGDDYDDEGKDKTVELKDLKQTRRKPKKRKNNKPKIQCDQCSKAFNYTSSLVYHRLSVHEKVRNFVCNICGRGFAHKQLLNNHKYVHVDEKYFNCEVCPAKFKSRASLYTHKRSRHSGVKEYSCNECGSQFSLKSSLIGHMRLHTGEKPFQCDFCQKKFAQRSSLREHRRTHTGEKPYQCTECSKSFTTASQLRSHKFSHSTEKLHMCHICGKGFNSSENFKYHLRRHNHEKPVECPVCKMQFAETWSFKKHYRLHTGEQPYKCEVCNKTWADPSNFHKHKKIHSNAANAIIEAPSSSTVNISEREEFVTSDGESVVQILDSGTVDSQTIPEEEVVYVYATEVMGQPYFTLEMPNDIQQTFRENPTAEATVSTSSNLDVGNLSASLETFSANDIESYYYSLETVDDGSTIAVPIQMPLSRAGTSQTQSSK